MFRLIIYLLPVIALFFIAKKGGVVGFSVLGVVLGAVVGFLLRPSVPLVGQLPLGVVLTRGENLTGLDTLFRSTAEQSFNYVLVGSIIGAVLMGVAKGMTSSSSKISPAP